jgi:cell division protein ZapA (FtsZ GTPase activity inhibitor)
MKVNLLGTSFTLQSDEPAEYLEAVVEEYESKLDEIRSSVETSDPVKLAILTGILLVDELMKKDGTRPSPSALPQQPSDELDEAERITLELIDKIDSTLEVAALKKDGPAD